MNVGGGGVGQKAWRTRTDLEVLGLPLAEAWDIVPAPGWDAKDDVCGEGKGSDRLEGEHCGRRGG